nr:hypothetical protein [Tanacetum cinerariifolium]
MAKEWCRSHGDANFGFRLLSERTATRQYNAPTVSEVSALIVNDFRDGFPIRDIVVNKNNTGPQRILELHPSYMTLGDTSAARLGKRIVLPRTYVGCPRYMMHNYQDAMALCWIYCNPDLFVTFTSNPKWPEIDEMLAYIPGQKSHDRPEVGTQVFKMKLIGLLEDLTKHHIFGKYYAVVYVIEFQKRGLNDIISAELPCPTNDPDAYKLVSEFMLHGPCGTVINKDGYPVYRLRDNKITAVKGKFTYDNRHVVPHNRYLLLKYHAHINVKCCNRSKAIKYLFKYLNKGPDRATIVIQENVKVSANRECDQIMSFTDLKMVNKINYATFKTACFAYGLLNDDKEWMHAIAEASIWAMAQQLHELFVTILLFYDVSRPLKLWEEDWVRINRENVLIQDHNCKIKIKTNDCVCCRLFSMRVNKYACNGEIDNRKQDFNRWVLAMGDGKLPAKKESEDEPTWIEILEEFLIKS